MGYTEIFPFSHKSLQYIFSILTLYTRRNLWKFHCGRGHPFVDSVHAQSPVEGHFWS